MLLAALLIAPSQLPSRHELWAGLGTTLAAAFLASLVECIEALTVVLAVGSVRGWRSPLLGSASALVALAAIVAVLGPALTRIPLHLVQLAVGVLILLFGLRWLRKAILRSAGLISLHDERAAFAKHSAAMRIYAPNAAAPALLAAKPRWEALAFTAAFNITMLEGTEVVFIVIALGAGGSGLLLPAGLGAVAALLVVIALGFALHRPLVRVPENTLKFIVGALLSGFGTFWVGEGAGLAWPGPLRTLPDLALPVLIAVWFAVALPLVPLCRIRARARTVEV